MKNKTMIIVLAAIAMLCSSCKPRITIETELVYGHSEVFSEEELKVAIEKVDDLVQGIPGWIILRVWYDEDMSNDYIQRLLEADYISEELVTGHNIIIIYCDYKRKFLIDERENVHPLFLDPEDPGYFYFRGYSIILTRENSTAEWQIVSPN